MIRRLLAPLALLPLLTAATCSRDVRPAVEFPQLPDLSAETRAACPAAEQVTGQLGDLAAKDAALAIQYAQCRQKHSTAVSAYGSAQQLLREADAKAKAAETPAKPR